METKKNRLPGQKRSHLRPDKKSKRLQILKLLICLLGLSVASNNIENGFIAFRDIPTELYTDVGLKGISIIVPEKRWENNFRKPSLNCIMSLRITKTKGKK